MYSGTTDYAYALDGGIVYASSFGSPWWPATTPEPDEEWFESGAGGDPARFPDMSEVQSVTLGPRSGLLVFGGKL